MFEKQFQNQQDMVKIYKRWRWLDGLATALAISGILMNIVEYEIAVIKNQIGVDLFVGGKLPNAMQLDRFKSFYSNVLRYLTLFTSIAAMFCLYLRRKYKNEWVNHLLS